MKNILKILMFITIIAVAVVETGCFGVMNAGEEFDAGDNDSWQKTVLSQDDGKSLSLELPFVLDGHQEITPGTALRKEEKYYHQVDDLTVAVDHGIMTDHNMEVEFSQENFLMDYGELDNQVCEKIEEINVNGQKMTYAKITAQKNNYPYTFECFAMHSENDYWIITYIYNEKNTKSRKIVEKSIKTITFK